MSWAAFWGFVEAIAVRLWGYYKSQPLAKPSTTAASPVPEEKVEEVCETIEENELWKAVQSREEDLKGSSLF